MTSPDRPTVVTGAEFDGHAAQVRAALADLESRVARLEAAPTPVEPTPAPEPAPTPVEPTPAPTPTPEHPFLLGTFFSHKYLDLYGLPHDMLGHWVNRAAWDDVRLARYTAAEASKIPAWKRDHANAKAVDEATTMIPAWPTRSTSVDPLLDEGASGARDADYLEHGRNLARNLPDKSIVRMQWEFNMGGGPTAGKFVACWRRAYPLIHQGFNELKRPGQELVIGWCPNGGPPNPEPFYPGDDVVDAIGMDMYMMKWQTTDPTFEQVRDHILGQPYGLNWLRGFALGRGKPLFIGETAQVRVKGTTSSPSMHGLGDEPRIIDSYFDWLESCLKQNGGPGVLSFMYFNNSTGGVEITLDALPQTVERLKVRVARMKTLTGA